MIDEKLIPEYAKRCSLIQFIGWLGFISLGLLWGAYGAFTIFAYGIGKSGLDNYFGFGLWITFDLAVIALGAGAFFSGFLKYIIRVDQLKHIINLTVMIGFLCYSGAMLILTLDVGQPLRAWFGYWHPNVHSMLTEVIFCITCYLIVLIIEFLPLVLENRQLDKVPFIHHLSHNLHIHMPLFAGIGTFLSFFHQGSLGGMYGVLFGRPYAFREGFFIWPWTFFLFILSAVASGPLFSVLVCKLIELLSGKKLVSFKVKALMGKIGGFMLCIYLFFKILDTWAWATETLHHMGMTFDQMFNDVYGKWLLWAEIGWCGILPAIILVTPKLRNTPILLYLAGILVCAGVTINRFVFTVQTIALPVMPFDDWYTYIPNWTEWSTSLMIICYGALVISLAHRYLPVFPQEKELNP